MSAIAAPRRSLLALDAAVLAAAFLAAFTRIADLDFWWHLKTGEVIAKTGRIPRVDIFSFTAAGAEYIDHEWLFQLLQWWTYSTLGPAGIAVLKCLVIGVTFALVARYCARDGAGAWAAFGLAALGLAGAVTRLIERPEIFSTLFTVGTALVLLRFQKSGNRRILAVLPLICALWANVHAAVIVGLVVQMLFILATFLERRPNVVPLGVAFAASVAASGINPFGYRVLSVPFELTRIIESGIVENAEWMRPTFRMAPVFWIAAVGVGIIFALRFRSTPVFKLLLFAFLAYVSTRYVRNVGLFCTFLPLLLSDALRSVNRISRVTVAATGLVALLVISILYFPFERGVGEASYFPDKLVQFTREKNLRGNMLNSYGFGGYLIAKLYPDRRVFIDGRNEVFVPLLERLQVAQTDSRQWSALLRDFKIEYVIFEYVDQLDRVNVVNRDGTQSAFSASLTSARFPRSQWALVFWDDDGMIFVRRAGPNGQALDGEYRIVQPEGTGFMKALVAEGRADRAGAIEELQRKLRDDPGSRRARSLLASLTQNQ